MTAITKNELEEVLEQLEEHKGRHTELISVYISAGFDINSVQKQLEAEKSTAKNIKSTSTRKNVTDALDSIVRYLKGLKKNPDNGLAIFCGNVSKVEGKDDMQLWDIEPPLPLKIRLYRCDKEFVLDPLREMMEVDEIFGLLVMDRKEATIGVLEGKSIDVLQKMSSGVPSKVRAGGQCLSPDSLIMKDNGEIITSGGRVLGVTGQGLTLKLAIKNTYKAVGQNGVHFPGMHYRFDIGRKGLDKKLWQ